MRIKKLLESRRQLHGYYLKKAGLTDKPVSIVTSVDNKIEDAFVKKVRECVEVHLSDFNFTVEELCRYVFMSHSQLRRKLEALTGCSPNKFIRIIRINKAKGLLKIPLVKTKKLKSFKIKSQRYFSRVNSEAIILQSEQTAPTKI